MSRLPSPGSDDGTWGDILNDFLGVEHNADGTLKASGSLSSKADDTSVVHLTGNESLGGTKTFVVSPVVPTPSLNTQAANKAYVDNALSSGVTPDADSTTKGKIQLSGDLGGAAGSPQVVATHLSSALPLSQGGTGSTSQNFVDLSTAQTVGGAKTFSSGVTVTANNTSLYLGDTSNAVARININDRAWLGYNGTSTYLQSGLNKSIQFNVNAPTAATGTVATVDTSGNWGYLTTAPTHTLTLGSSSTGVSAYNTSDQTINFERLRQYWNNNVYTLATDAGGTGTGRAIQIQSNFGPSLNINNGGGASAAAPKIKLDVGGTSTNYAVALTSSPTNASGTFYPLTIAPVFNQTGTAGYTALLVNPTETATGSGSKLLADFQVGGTSKTSIDTAGNHIFHTGAAPYFYNTTDETTNYERVRQYWSANQYFLFSEAGGTGTARQMNIGTSSTAVVQIGSSSATTTYAGAGGTYKILHTVPATTVAGIMGMQTIGTLGATTAGNQSLFAVTPTITQSGPASYTAFLVNSTETTTGSGTKYLADFQVGGVSKSSIDNFGSHILHNGARLTFYNTIDETTNYERFLNYWNGNIFTMLLDSGGTGVQRSLQLNVGGSLLSVGAASPAFTFARNTTSVASLVNITSTSFQASSASQSALTITPTINQSGTAGYSMFVINPAETATGSGTKLLADFQVGSVSKFSVSNTGLVVASNRITNVSDPTSAQDAATKNYVDTTRFETLNAMGNVTGATNVDLSTAPNFTMTLTGSTVLTFTNVPTGAKVVAVTLYVTQDATGSRTLDITGRQGAFGSNALANLSATAGATDEVICRSLDNGAHWIVSLGAQGIA